jgi:DNA-binding NarL/FixJ family response regulator
LSTSNSLNVIVLDDHPLITDGIQSLLNDSPKFKLTAVTHTLAELISEITKAQPDILILDLNIKGGNILGNIEDLQTRFPKTKILIFSSYNTPSLVKKAFNKGVNGYLLKDTTQTELLEALDAIAGGKIYIGERVAIKRKVNKPNIIREEVQDDFDLLSQLSEREMEIIQLIVDGLDSKQISSRLFISLHTVQSHRKNILKKLRLHSAAEIIKFALKNKLR